MTVILTSLYRLLKKLGVDIFGDVFAITEERK